MGLNLSEWALKHRSFVVYLMLAASLAGASSFYRLGRDEDPPFTVRTMLVAAKWPGATIDETLNQVTERLERRLLVLATVGSAGPFIGLFGTVWGIMTSFQAIAASKNTSLAVVAPGIAEALFATAIGLVAAIPATIFYNKFSSEVNKQAQRLEGFADEFAAILSRQIDERA